MRRRARGLFCRVACAWAAPGIAVPAGAPALEPPRLSRERMESALDGSERLLVVYGTQDPAGARRARADLRIVAHRAGRPVIAPPPRPTDRVRPAPR